MPSRKVSAKKSGNLWAVVMAGGSGTRFWPESREKTPKQFLPLFGSKTLFQQTIERVASIIPKSRVIVVTQKKYEAQAIKLGRLSKSQIIGEPVGRNTAPCVALAAQRILQKDPHAVLAILPSDHQIGKPELFRKAIQAAGEVAYESGMPVTFGIKPDFPHTGYGYLEKQKLFVKKNGLGVFRLKQFHEKPSLPKAKRFVASGKFLWNSGMFIWRADKLVQACEGHLPEVDRLSCAILQGKNFGRNLNRLYPKMPNVSIDYGLMEKMKGKILTLPVDIKWCDLGGWLAFKDLWPADANGNVFQGPVLQVGTKGSLARGRKRLIALVGVKDLVVVDTEDAVLIASKQEAESIKKIVGLLKEKNKKKYL